MNNSDGVIKGEPHSPPSVETVLPPEERNGVLSDSELTSTSSSSGNSTTISASTNSNSPVLSPPGDSKDRINLQPPTVDTVHSTQTNKFILLACYKEVKKPGRGKFFFTSFCY